MQVHKITLVIIDHDGLGADGCVSALENTQYSNDALSATAVAIDTVEIGEWEDENPLNFSATFFAEAERLFNRSRRLCGVQSCSRDYGHFGPCGS